MNQPTHIDIRNLHLEAARACALSCIGDELATRTARRLFRDRLTCLDALSRHTSRQPEYVPVRYWRETAESIGLTNARFEAAAWALVHCGAVRLLACPDATALTPNQRVRNCLFADDTHYHSAAIAG